MKPSVQSPTEHELDRLISTRFTVSLMNDSKWERLVERLTDIFTGGIHVSYKLIHSDVVHQTTLATSDFKPFFLEPTLYREIEWLEFPHRYEDFVDRDNKKAGTRICEQNVSAIQCEIHQIGKFELEDVATGLRLHAYK